MRGYYRINGVLVPNLITHGGRKTIRRVLAGQGVFGDAFVYGVGTSKATVNDTELGFEIGREQVSLKLPDDDLGQILFKTTLPAAEQFKITELGLYSSFTNATAGDFGSRLLFNFEPDIEPWINAVYEAGVGSIGANSLKITNVTSGISTASISSVLNLSGYSNNDEIKAAFVTSDNKTSYIVLRFKVSNEAYFEFHVDGTNFRSNDYNVVSLKKGSALAYGNADWSSITEFEIDVASTAASYVHFDGIRIEDVDTANDYYLLLSRAVVTEPIVKQPGETMEIEYILDVN